MIPDTRRGALKGCMPLLGGEIVETLVVAMVITVLDEPRQFVRGHSEIVVFEQDVALQGQMSSRDVDRGQTPVEPCSRLR
jgi:hypothetical protein